MATRPSKPKLVIDLYAHAVARAAARSPRPEPPCEAQSPASAPPDTAQQTAIAVSVARRAAHDLVLASTQSAAAELREKMGLRTAAAPVGAQVAPSVLDLIAALTPPAVADNATGDASGTGNLKLEDMSLGTQMDEAGEMLVSVYSGSDSDSDTDTVDAPDAPDMSDAQDAQDSGETWEDVKLPSEATAN
jgi:hypothetical protein